VRDGDAVADEGNQLVQIFRRNVARSGSVNI